MPTFHGNQQSLGVPERKGPVPVRNFNNGPFRSNEGIPNLGVTADSTYPVRRTRRLFGPAVLSFGFALVTAAFSADLTVPSIAQANLTGYKYPAKQVRQTEFQDGWVETATHEWSVDRTPYSLDQRMSDRVALKYRYADYPGTDWIYQNLPVADVWDESKFQNNSGDWTPARKALLYRYADYPGTDWIYQNLLVDARAIQPALDHLSSSTRTRARREWPQSDQFASIWLTTTTRRFLLAQGVGK